MGIKRKQVPLGPFLKGKNNVQKESSIPLDSLNEALNVDILDDGKIERRKGYDKKYSGSDIHSLFSGTLYTVFVEGTSLKILNEDYTASTLTTGLTPNSELDFVEVNGIIYYSGVGRNGKISVNGVHESWGMDAPKSQPVPIAVSGGSAAGIYQVQVTFANADGEESGTREAAAITLTSGQMIRLTNIPQGDADYIKVYCTQPNGTVLYHQMTLSMGTTTADINYLENGEEIDKQFGDKPPFGQFVEYYNGRIYVADGNVLYFSEPYDYGFFKPGKNYIEYPSEIKFIKSINTGLYVGSDIVYFLRGDTPSDQSQKMAYLCSPIYRSAILTESTLFNFENVFGEVVFFWSDVGAMIGTEEGVVIPLSQKRYVPDKYEKAISTMRREDGITQIVTAVTKKGEVNRLKTSDSASATVIRNGITIG